MNFFRAVAQKSASKGPVELSKSRSILDGRKLSDVFERQLKNDGAAQHEVATPRKDHSSLAHPERLFHVHADFSDFTVLIHCHGGHLANLYSLGGLDSPADQLCRIGFFQHWRLR